MKNLGVTVLSALILAAILIGTWQYRQLQTALFKQQQPPVVYQPIQAAPLSPWLSGEFSLLGSKTPPEAYTCMDNFIFNEKLCGYAATEEKAILRLEFREHLHHHITGPAKTPCAALTCPEARVCEYDSAAPDDPVCQKKMFKTKKGRRITQFQCCRDTHSGCFCTEIDEIPLPPDWDDGKTPGGRKGEIPFPPNWDDGETPGSRKDKEAEKNGDKGGVVPSP